MSPEQARGESAGTASDIFSLGVMLYELATGTHPFETESMLGMLHAITSLDTPSPQQRRPDLSPRFERLLRRMLGKHAPARPSARDVHAELTAIGAGADQSPPQAYGRSPHERRRQSPRAGRVLVGGAVVVIALAGAAGWTWYRGADARWARDVAIPRIEHYVDASNWEAAYALAKEVQVKVPDNEALAELWPRFSWVTTIPSDPAGARVYRRPYSAKDDESRLCENYVRRRQPGDGRPPPRYDSRSCFERCGLCSLTSCGYPDRRSGRGATSPPRICSYGSNSPATWNRAVQHPVR